MGEVVELNVVTRLDLPVERIIAGAAEAKLTEVLVIGFAEDGSFYFAANQAAGPENLWLLELAKKKLLEVGDADDGGPGAA